MTTVVSSPFPRKTRSGSRSVPAKAGSTPDSTEVDAQPFPNVAVMKASSMEPVFVRRALQDKRPRHKMTDHQLQRLEELYQANTHPSREEKDGLAREIGMTLKSVMIWFQNRRQDRRRKPSTSAVIARAPQASSTPETTPSPALQHAGPRKRPVKPLPARAADKRVKLTTRKASVTSAPSPLWAVQVTSSDQAQTTTETETSPLPDFTATSHSGTTAQTRTPRLPDFVAKFRPEVLNSSQRQRVQKAPRQAKKYTSTSQAAIGHLQGETRTRRRPVTVPEIMVSSGGEDSVSAMDAANSPVHGARIPRDLLEPTLSSSRASSVTVRDSSRDAFRHVHFKASSPSSPQHNHCTTTPLTFDSPPSTTSTLPLRNSSNTSSSTLQSYKPNLDWACANSAARRKHGLFVYRDEDDSSGESSDFEDDLASRGRRREGNDAFGPSKRRRLHIPEEYHTICSPDLVFGATLLLGLKHSVNLL